MTRLLALILALSACTTLDHTHGPDAGGLAQCEYIASETCARLVNSGGMPGGNRDECEYAVTTWCPDHGCSGIAGVCAVMRDNGILRPEAHSSCVFWAVDVCNTER